jgi:MFS superfamily sulfate permease-like transporter
MSKRLTSQNSNSDGHWRQDFLASLVVFLVALPLCMGIALASGAPASTGLISGAIGGIVSGLLAGCQLQVSGPAAGLTVVYDCVQQYGLEMLGLIVLIAGIMQMLAAVLRLGEWFRAVSPAVVRGMLAGIGVLIFASQFHVMLDDVPTGNGLRDLISIPKTLSKALRWSEIPQRDLRHETRTLLQDLGELHRRQMFLNEQVTEQLPNHWTRTSESFHVDLSPFVDEQLAINEDFTSLLDQSYRVFEGLPEKQKSIAVVGREAIGALQLSLEDLRQHHRGAIVQDQQAAAMAIERLQAGFKNHEFAAALGILTILSLVGWKVLARGHAAIVPAPLVAVIVVTACAAVWQLPVLYVEAPDSIFQELHVMTLKVVQDAPWQGVLGSALMIALLASAQTLLTASATDQLHSGPRTQYNRELFAQGVGNVLCGFLGALPIAGVIVRSSTNVDAGGRTRWSTVLHGVWILIFIAFLGSFLRLIPTSALAAILVYTGYKLVNWNEARQLAAFGRGEVAIWAITLGMVVVQNLLVGVLVGFGLAVAKLLIKFTRLRIRLQQGLDPCEYLLRLEGPATFLRIPKLAKRLEDIPDGTIVTFETSRLSYLDQACLELLRNWAAQHESRAGSVIADWKHLHALAHQQPAGHDSVVLSEPVGDSGGHPPPTWEAS